MKPTIIASALLAGVAVTACDSRDEAADNIVTTEVVNESDGAADSAASGTNTTSWPEGARIVVEDGVTYRVDPGGVRVRLGAADSRVEVIDGVRYRIDPGGTRVRIDEEGAVISVGPGGVDATVPVGGDTSVTINRH